MTGSVVTMRPSLDVLMTFLGSWIVIGGYDQWDGDQYEIGPYRLVGVLTAAPGVDMDHQLFLDSYQDGKPASGGFEFELEFARLRYVLAASPPAHALVGPDERCGLA